VENATILQRVSGALLALVSAPLAADLKPGDDAPAFELLDQHSRVHKLSDYRGQWLVLYFYPRDDTPGCTTEACEFRDDVFMLKRMGVALLGISTDDVKSHQEFAEKYHLPFSLLSDPDGEVAREYGSLTNLGLLKFAKRHTFVIDPDNRVAKVYRNVQPKTHSDQVIADLKALRNQ
jgi:peroxiredoxin Q/BCP